MTEVHEIVRPPERPGPLTWMRTNLFNTWFNSILTLVSLVVIYFVVSGLARWVLSADWRPVLQNPVLFLVGQYPRDQLWRIGSIAIMISFLFGVSWGVWGGIMRSFAILLSIFIGAVGVFPGQLGSLSPAIRAALLGNAALVYVGYFVGNRLPLQGRHVLVGWLVSFALTPLLLRGFEQSTALPGVDTNLWGGLLVTLLLAVGGILLSFPIGVLLALGRRSSLPVVKLFCTALIEMVRGVPLVTILFMSSIILALFLPPGVRIDRLVRALMGMTIFSAAYTAENVRGGLQSIPQGQIEAAQAVGLNNFQTTLLIVLPQALRAVIPAIVGQFISLFKDTTLAIIVAITELLAIGKAVLQSDTEFLRLQAEVYIFIAVVFWVFSYFMSYASRRLETALGVGER